MSIEKTIQNYWEISSRYNGRTPRAPSFAEASNVLNGVLETTGPHRPVKALADRLLDELITQDSKKHETPADVIKINRTK